MSGTANRATYAVNLWGSDPSLGRDDCITGDDFTSLKEARAVYAEPELYFPAVCLRGATFVQLDGPGVHEERRIAADREPSDDYADRSEAYMVGMMGGVDAYNLFLGYE